MARTYFQTNNPATYSADGVIDITKDSINLAGSSAIAMTLPDPPTSWDGAIITLISTTAAAHTVTNTTGFGGGGSTRDVATWGGAIGDALIIQAWAGVWHTLSLDGVSLG